VALNPRHDLHLKPSRAQSDAHRSALMSAHYEVTAGGSDRRDTLGALDTLVRRHAGGNDLPRHLPHVRIADALVRGDDPLHLLPYFTDIGVQIANLEDLLAACTDPGEEEIEAFRVEEGVAVYLIVDGQWALFTR